MVGKATPSTAARRHDRSWTCSPVYASKLWRTEVFDPSLPSIASKSAYYATPGATNFTTQTTLALGFGLKGSGWWELALVFVTAILILLAALELWRTGELWAQVVVCYGLGPLIAMRLLTLKLPLYFPRYLLGALPGLEAMLLVSLARLARLGYRSSLTWSLRRVPS